MQTLKKTRSRGRTSILIIGLVVVLGAAGATAVVLNNNADGAGGSQAADRHVVSRTNFDITIPASGELAALRQITVVNRLESRAHIKTIVEEGTYVQAGDVLFTLASKDIEDRINDSEDAVSVAEAAHASTIADKEILEKAEKADVDRTGPNIVGLKSTIASRRG